MPYELQFSHCTIHTGYELKTTLIVDSFKVGKLKLTTSKKRHPKEKSRVGGTQPMKIDSKGFPVQNTAQVNNHDFKKWWQNRYS